MAFGAQHLRQLKHDPAQLFNAKREPELGRLPELELEHHLLLVLVDTLQLDKVRMAPGSQYHSLVLEELLAFGSRGFLQKPELTRVEVSSAELEPPILAKFLQLTEGFQETPRTAQDSLSPHAIVAHRPAAHGHGMG